MSTSNSSFYQTDGAPYGTPTITPENLSASNGSFYAYMSAPLTWPPFVPPVVSGNGTLLFNVGAQSSLIALLEDI
jgi:hypothetical protein